GRSANRDLAALPDGSVRRGDGGTDGPLRRRGQEPATPCARGDAARPHGRRLRRGDMMDDRRFAELLDEALASGVIPPSATPEERAELLPLLPATHAIRFA